MNNIDSILFTKNFISSLRVEGFFYENDNPFMDEGLLYDEILKRSINNMRLYENPEITSEQFNESIVVVKTITIRETIEGLIEKGLIEPTALDNNGEFLYSITEDVINEQKKK
jgi:hypothetical protein